jgi:hypothetical protein
MVRNIREFFGDVRFRGAALAIAILGRISTAVTRAGFVAPRNSVRLPLLDVDLSALR